MPSGQAHAVMSFATAGLTYVYASKNGDPPDLAVATAIGSALGTLFNPDLDVKGTRADRIVRESWGTIPAIVWGILWNPYSRLIPHRSVWSHGLILGTTLRFVYIAIPLFVLGILPKMTPVSVRIGLGILLSDNVHIGADFFITGLRDFTHAKRKQRRN